MLEIDKKCLSDVEEWLGIENIKIVNDKHVAEVKLPYDNGLISKIISYGNGIKVISPLELSKEIKKYAQDILDAYK